MNEIEMNTVKAQAILDAAEKQKLKSEMIRKRDHTIEVLSQIRSSIEDTQDTMKFWIRRLNEELELLKKQEKTIKDLD